ncbi:PAS domain S-box protein [Deinococcus misasensis]|uniref:PAS domain S-box protein n=1 Tax=Deinococcus misasensis TaxID=392413 RepID=UPI00055037B2|nr:PAS domain S-box protein [Deinococcus misasensis]
MDRHPPHQDVFSLSQLVVLSQKIEHAPNLQTALNTLHTTFEPVAPGLWLRCFMLGHPEIRIGPEPKADPEQVMQVLKLSRGTLRVGASEPLDARLKEALQLVLPALERLVDRILPAAGQRPEFQQALLSHMSEGLVVCDAQGVLVSFNSTIRHIHGQDMKHLPYPVWPEAFHLYTPDGRRMLQPEEVPLYRALQGEHVENHVVMVRPPGLPERILRFQGGQVRSAQGEVLGALVIGTDITEMVQQEQQLHTRERLILHEHLARAQSNETLKYTSALLNISEALLEATDVLNMCDRVLSLGTRLLDAMTGAVFVLEEDQSQHTLQLVHSLNTTEAAQKYMQQIALQADHPVAEVARTGKPFVMQSKDALLKQFPHLQDVVQDIRASVLVILPIAHREQVLGVLYFGFEGNRKVTEQDLSVIDNIARQMALALLRHRLQKAQDQLVVQHQETAALLQAIVHNAPVGLAFLDDQLTFKMVNQPMARMLNARPEDFMGSTPTLRFPLFGKVIEKELQEVLRTGKAVLDIEYNMPEGMGRPIQDWLVNYFPVKTPHGEPLGVGATIQDITAQKTADRVLQESQIFRERIMQSAPVGIYLLDLRKQHMVYSNQHMAEVLGYQPEEVSDLSLGNVVSIVHPEDQRKTLQLLQQMEALNSGDVLETEARFQHKDGSWRWFFVKYTLFSRTPEDLLVLGLALDVTERHRIEQALNESEQRFRDVANSVPILIWMSDDQRNRTFFNRTWLEFTGQSAEQSAGYGWTQLVHPEDVERYLQVYHHHFEQQKAFQIEYRLRRFDGQYRWILARGVPRFSSSGAFLGFIGGCIEMHDRKMAEEALHERESELRNLMQVQKRFVADAAHELRTPLTAIQGNLDIMIRHRNIPEPEKMEIISDVQREATRLGRLVNDMLTLARGDSGLAFNEEEVELHGVLRSVFKDMERVSAKHHIALGQVDEMQLYGDTDRLKQLFLILLENAIKYTPSGGYIRGSLVHKGKVAEFRLQDDGVGIAPQDLERVFERFYRADQSRHRGEDPGGTGLGLPIAKWIVEQHGGHIWLENNPTQGITAVVQLPLEDL